MKAQLSLVTTALIFTLAGCISTRNPGEEVAGPVGQRIDRFVRDSIPTFSGQILVARSGQVLLHRPYGLADREAGRANTVTTVFDIGSLTKQFTATATLALAEDGALSLNDTLGKFLPGLPALKSGLSLHMLLTHSAGLPQYSGEDYDPILATDLEAWLDTVSLELKPGERFRYSNPGYSVLALVVEKVSGRPFESYVRSRLLEPAGLLRTGYRLPPWNPRELAVGYALEHGRVGTPLDRFWHPDGPSWNLRGNGGMLSTAAQLYRWQQALVTGRVLSQRARDQLLTGYVDAPRPNRRYAYGWYVNKDDHGRGWIDHTGGNGAFFAMVRWYEEPDVVFVVTSNSFDANTIRALVAGLVRLTVDAPVT